MERFFARPSAAVVALTAPLRLGDLIYVAGRTTDFRQTVDSMEIDHVPVRGARAGDVVGIRMAARCRKRDLVYRLPAA